MRSAASEAMASLSALAGSSGIGVALGSPDNVSRNLFHPLASPFPTPGAGDSAKDLGMAGNRMKIAHPRIAIEITMKMAFILEDEAWKLETRWATVEAATRRRTFTSNYGGGKVECDGCSNGGLL